MNNMLEEKQNQHTMLKQQIRCLTKEYNLSTEEQVKLSQDIADVILTSWDLKASESMEFGDTWFKEELEQN